MPPKITILGDASSATKAFDEATAGAQRLEKATGQVSAGFGRSKIAGIRLKSTLGGLAPVAGGLVVAGQAARELGDWLHVSGEEATTTQGIFRNAGAELLSGNFVGAIEALAVHVPTATEKLDALRRSADASYDDFIHLKSGSRQAADSIEEVRQKLEAAGTTTGGFHDQLVQAEAQLREASAESNKFAASLFLSERAARAVEDALKSAGSEAARFGEQVRGAGDVAAQARMLGSTGRGKIDLTLTGENQAAIADARVARTKTLSDNLALARKRLRAAQAAEAKADAAGIVEGATARLRATEEALTEVQRIEDQIAAAEAAAAAKAAAAAAKAAREREQAAREAARRAEEARRARLARVQAAQDVALGLGTPSVDNLKKQFESLAKRVGDNPASTLQKRLQNVRRILAGEFGKITRDTRANIQGLYDAIRQELDKGAKGPLTKTTGLNAARIVGGLGLSRAEERALRARLSGFNSAGVALAASNDVNLTIAIDGRAVEHSVTKNQQRRARANPPARRGR